MSGCCDNFPDWQGCECCGADGKGMDAGHDGPHVCVCGARWDDDGHPLDIDGNPTGLDLPRRADNEAVLKGTARVSLTKAQGKLAI